MYELSWIEFDEKGLVTGYSNTSQNLHVQLVPKEDKNIKGSSNFFTIGSSKEQVLNVQGTPSSINKNSWYFGLSWVEFDYYERVKRYSNRSNNLKVVNFNN